MIHKDIKTEEEVQLYSSPWVSNTRVLSYFGPVNVELCNTEKMSFEQVFEELDKIIRNKTFYLGGNAVVGHCYTLDLWSVPPRYQAEGTAARLEDIF